MELGMTKLILLAFTAEAAVAQVSFEDCGSTSSDIKFSCSEGCDGDVMELKKGSDVDVELDFKPGHDANSLTNNVIGILDGGMEMPYNVIIDEDFCKGLEGGCPISEGADSKFKTSLNILDSFPTIPVTIKWEVTCDQGNKVICLKIKSKIVD